MNYELHPLCTLFPRLQGAEFDSLVEDIKANGLRQAIVLHDGMILDGGNRYRACVEAGVKPLFTSYTGTNLVTYVLSANLHRRHLSAGQQAAIVASAQDWGKAQTVGNPAFKGQKCNVAPLDTAAGRAAESGASLRTQKMADKVARADPALAVQVAHGEVSLPKAHAQVSPPKTVKPEPVDEVAALRAERDEAMRVANEALADNTRMGELFDADDRTAALSADNKKLRAQVSALTERVNGLMNEKNEAIRAAKMWQRKAQQVAA